MERLPNAEVAPTDCDSKSSYALAVGQSLDNISGLLVASSASPRGCAVISNYQENRILDSAPLSTNQSSADWNGIKLASVSKTEVATEIDAPHAVARLCGFMLGPKSAAHAQQTRCVWVRAGATPCDWVRVGAIWPAEKKTA